MAKPFADIPEVKTKPRRRSLAPFNPIEPTLLIHSALETPIYRFTMASSEGPITSVWLNDATEAKRILLNEEGIWRKGPQTFEPFSSLVPKHLIALEGEYHAKLRAKAQSALGDALAEPGRIPGEKVGARLVELIRNGLHHGNCWMGTPGALIDGTHVFVTDQLDRIFRSAALDIVSCALFGASWGVLEEYTSDNVRADTLARLMHELHWRVADFAVREWRHDSRAAPAGELLDSLDSFVLDEIEKSYARSTPGCMLDAWTQVDSGLSTEEIRNLCMTFLTMGSENVSTGLAWCAVCLSENLEAQRKARISKAALTEAFHEAVRLLTRMSLEDTTLCGYEVPRCTEVVVNMYAIHRDPLLWTNPTEFLPARCPVVSTQGPPDAFPFGGGARSCIGRPLTMHELHNVLGTVLEHFELVPVIPQGDRYERNTDAKTTANNFVSLRPGKHLIAFVPRKDLVGAKL